jgi:hypothetical protein
VDVMWQAVDVILALFTNCMVTCNLSLSLLFSLLLSVAVSCGSSLIEVDRYVITLQCAQTTSVLRKILIVSSSVVTLVSLHVYQ